MCVSVCMCVFSILIKHILQDHEKMKKFCTIVGLFLSSPSFSNSKFYCMQKLVEVLLYNFRNDVTPFYPVNMCP